MHRFATVNGIRMRTSDLAGSVGRWGGAGRAPKDAETMQEIAGFRLSRLVPK